MKRKCRKKVKKVIALLLTFICIVSLVNQPELTDRTAVRTVTAANEPVYAYDFSKAELNDVKDSNGNSMYVVPAVLYDYYNEAQSGTNGAVLNDSARSAQDKFQFWILNRALSQYARENGMEYPLYVGDFEPFTGSGDYEYPLINAVNENKLYHPFYFLNHANLTGDYDGVIQGITGDKLVNGNLTTRDNVAMPFFHDSWIKETVYKNTEYDNDKSLRAENIALNKHVYASNARAAYYGASNAVDGDTSTMWQSAASNNTAYEQYLIVDLGSVQTVGSFKLIWGDAYASGYQIQVSADNENWTNVYADWSGTGGTVSSSFKDQSGEGNINISESVRYVKLYASQSKTVAGYAVKEFEIFSNNQCTGTNLAVGKTASASSELTESTGSAGNAVDGNTSTVWTPGYSSRADQYLIVDLGEKMPLNRVEIIWGNNLLTNEILYPSEYSIQTTADENWQTAKWENIAYNANPAVTLSGQMNTESFGVTTARYIKLYTGENNRYFSVREIKISCGGDYANEQAFENSPVGKVYGSLENPLAFPIRYDSTDGYYKFISGSGIDNVQLVEDSSTSSGYRFNYYSVDNEITGVYNLNKGENNSDVTGFFPLNASGDTEEKLNYGFGMRLEIPFTIPADKKNPLTGDDIEFNFSGDDDVWIYVDGVRVLDLGGMHSKSSGRINFTRDSALAAATVDIDWSRVNADDEYWTTSATYSDVTSALMTPASSDTTVSLSELGLDFSDPTRVHTLTMFYMERGMQDSNLEFSFNFQNKDTLAVSETVNTDNVGEFWKDIIDTIVSEEEFSLNLTDSTIGEGTEIEYSISSENNTSLVTGMLSNGESFILKDGQIASFSDGLTRDDVMKLIENLTEEQNNKYTTSWTLTDQNGEILGSGTDNTVTDNRTYDDQFELNSKTKLLSTDLYHNVFLSADFVKTVNVTDLTVTKIQNDADADKDKEYEFKIEYSRVFGKETNGVYNGKYQIGTAEYDAGAEGIIRIKAGETAVIKGIPVESAIKVTEVDSSDLVDIRVNGVSQTVIDGGASVNLTKDEASCAFEFTNGKKELVYFSEIGRTVDLPVNLGSTAIEDGSVITAKLSDNQDKLPPYVQVVTDSEGKTYLKYTYPSQNADGQENQALIDKFTVVVENMDENSHVLSTREVPVTVYNYRLNKDIYVLDYGLDVDLMDTAFHNGMLQNDCLTIDGVDTEYTFFGVKDTGTDRGKAVPVNAYVSGTKDAAGTALSAIDGDEHTVWESKPSDADAWIIVDLGKVKSVDHLELIWADAYAKGYQIETTTEASYQEADENNSWNKNVYSNWNGKGGTEEVVLTGVKARLIKVYMSSKVLTDRGYALKEFNVYESAVYSCGDGEYNNELSLENGTVNCDQRNGTLQAVYRPTDFMDSIDTFYYGIQVKAKGQAAPYSAQNATPVMTSEVKVLPASVVYYEDNFGAVVYEETEGVSSVERNTGALTSLRQSNSITDIYGFDTVYDGKYTTGYGETKLTTTTDYGRGLSKVAKARFTFKGTGLDIVGRTSTESSIVTVKVYPHGNTQSALVTRTVDTFYAHAGSSGMCQIPVIHIEGLSYGEYDVVIAVLPADPMEVNAGTVRTTFYLDGIRIYTPLGDDTGYYSQKEAGASVREIRKEILGKNESETAHIAFVNTKAAGEEADTYEIYDFGGSVTTENMDGIITLDGILSVTSIEDYEQIGPNNEVYLADGQALAFILSAEGTAGEESRTLQIEAKSLCNGENERFVLSALKCEGKRVVSSNLEINSATARYYEIPVSACTDLGDGTYLVVLKAQQLGISSGNISPVLSLTNIKTKGYSLLYPTKASALSLTKALSYRVIEESGETVNDDLQSTSPSGESAVKENTYMEYVTDKDGCRYIRRIHFSVSMF